ncbi:MAG TPA: ABC transporter ATP-binding protein [Desulfurococcales archaeon]|nr:ABC transporter ATP-binding protein [Desulfurococcales archaeon]
MTEAIRVENLTFYYEGEVKPALKNINLSINEGEYVIITGPSGSGKSTLCRTFNGLIPHFYKGKMEGEVYVKGLRVKEHSVRELSKIVGMVFQEPENQVLTLSVKDEIAFGLENLGYPPNVIEDRIEHVLDVMGIKHLKNKVIFELSGGELQKVIVASILAMNPDILVFDEPTSNMDPKSALDFLKYTVKINKEYGKTVIIVEHRLDYIISYASKIVVLNDGEIVAIGNPRKVLMEDILEDIGISIPQIPLLFKKLKRLLPCCETPLTIEEALSLLGRVIAEGSYRGT